MHLRPSSKRGLVSGSDFVTFFFFGEDFAPALTALVFLASFLLAAPDLPGGADAEAAPLLLLFLDIFVGLFFCFVDEFVLGTA